jgi:predicted dienelactone hydrolase
MKLALVYGMLGLLSATQVCAEPVGETHRATSEKTASLRDAGHRDQLRITVWYPAAADAVERPLAVGPPERPLYNIGSVALNAAFAAERTQWPVILLSHGFGGTAQITGWFDIETARDGYIVVAVDRPGNNAVDQITVPGAALYWDRADDLRAALEATKRDPSIGPIWIWPALVLPVSLPEGSPRLWRQGFRSIDPTSLSSVRPIPTTACAGRNRSSG